MAAPPPDRKLNTDDIPEAPSWLGKLVLPLNSFIAPVAAALKAGLTFKENFAGEVKTVTVTPPDDWTYLTSGFGGGWSLYDGTNFPVAYRKTEHGEVVWRGLVKGGALGFGAPVVSFTGALAGLAPVNKHPFAVVSNYAFGSAEVQTGGLYAAVGSAAWFGFDGVQYMASDRTPPRWATPVTVKLGTPQKPYAGRPATVIVLSARQQNAPTAPVAVSAIDWTATTSDKSTAIQVWRVWGLAPGVAYSLTLAILPE